MSDTTRDATRIIWRCALDNHEPARHYAHGEALRYAPTNAYYDDPVIVLHDVDTLGGLDKACSANYLIDNGMNVTVWYVAGWNPPENTVILHPFPTEWTVDGRVRKQRADNGRDVDYRTWMLGPRRSYHLKIEEV